MKKKILSILMGVTLTLSTSTIFANELVDTEYIKSMANIINDNYFYGIEDGKLTEGAVKGLFLNLDPYSSYYTKEEYKRLTENLTGEMESAGIGIKIIEDKGYINIIEVIKDNSAEKAGLKAGDIIVSVDGKNIKGMAVENVSNLVRGEVGTTVKIGVVRENEENILYFNATRQQIVFNPVEYRELESNIGYVKINEFNNNSLIEVKKALNQFDAKNIKKIVFDVRDNPGGYLTSVIDTLKLLVPEGPIVHVKDAHGNQHTYNSFNKSPKYKLMVLTNENSASASEIFAGAIKERNVGKVVGTNTFGKGTVQNIMPLENGAAVKLTVAEYFTPKMDRVNKIGIAPDIVVNDAYNKEGTDPVLKKAVEEIKK